MAGNLAALVRKEYVVEALEEMISTNPRLNNSTGYDLIYKEKKFPPKEVVRLAAQKQGIEGWKEYSLNGGEPVNKYFKKMGFEIRSKTNNSNEDKMDMNTDNVQAYDKPAFPLNTIFYGPPGTGKTYHTISRALQIADHDFYEANKHDRLALTARFKELLIRDWINPQGQIAFITFHQSLSYEDFIEGIKPDVIQAGNDEDQEMVKYEVKDGLFKLMAQKATWREGNFESVIEAFKKDCNELENKQPVSITSKYTNFKVAFRGTGVLYVRPDNSKKADAWYPVNLANIRKVYETESYEGVYNPTYVREILEYLKRNKNLIKSKDNINQKPLPHILIIDEINRGNIAQIFGELITLIEPDKRAGKPEEIELFLPNSKNPFSVPDNLYIIGTMNTADRSVEALDAALRRRFNFIFMPPQHSLLTDQDQQPLFIGGINIQSLLNTINERISYLIDEDHQIGHAYFFGIKNENDLRIVFKDKIIPLLKEYFFNDYGKIRMILGDGFVEKKGNRMPSFAVKDNDYHIDRTIYKIIQPEDDFDIIGALAKMNLHE